MPESCLEALFWVFFLLQDEFYNAKKNTKSLFFFWWYDLYPLKIIIARQEFLDCEITKYLRYGFRCCKFLFSRKGLTNNSHAYKDRWCSLSWMPRRTLCECQCLIQETKEGWMSESWLQLTWLPPAWRMDFTRNLVSWGCGSMLKWLNKMSV